LLLFLVLVFPTLICAQSTLKFASEGELRAAYGKLTADADKMTLIEANPHLVSWAFIQSLGNQGPRDPRMSALLLTFALDIAEKNGDKTALRSILPNLGNASRDYGDIARAVSMFERALEFGKSIDDKDYQARILLNLGLNYGLLSQLDKAIAATTESIRLSEELGKREGIISGLINLSNHYNGRGDALRSIEALNRARNILEATGTSESSSLMRTSQAAAVFSSLGSAYQRLGDTELAMQNYQRSLEINKDIGRNGSTVYINMGNAYVNTDQRRARELFDLAIEAERTSGTKATFAAALRGRALTCLRWADYPCALQYYKQSYAIAEELGGVSDADRLEVAIAQFRTGQPDVALPVAESIAKKPKRTEFETEAFYYNTMNASILAARIHGSRGHREAQEKYLDSAIALANDVYRLYARMPFSLSYLRPLETVAFQDKAELLVRQGRLDEAMSVVEKAKARALVDTLAGSEPNYAAPVNDEYRIRDRSLAAQQISLGRQINGEISRGIPDRTRLERLQAELRQSQATRNALELSLFRSRPAQAYLQDSLKPLALSEAGTITKVTIRSR
jgi:tetratricopeptide (TPR) repeat protein